MSVPPVLLLRDPVRYVRRAMNDLDTLCLIISKQTHCFEIDQANLVKVECDVRTIICDARFELVDVLPLHFGRSVGSSSLVHQIHFQSLRSFFFLTFHRSSAGQGHRHMQTIDSVGSTSR